ncbi:energy transducer TonB [Elusimicrobiota bacterium]
MKFRTSVIVSTIFHAVLFIAVPDLWFSLKRPSWVEVSVITFPDIKKSIPDWRPGKEVKPEPAAKIPEINKDELPVPLESETIGMPVRSDMPDFTDIQSKMDIPVKENYKKIIPGRKKRKGILEGEGEDSVKAISGPISTRDLLREVRPKYPAWAEEKGIEGEVKLKFWVSPEGFVTSVELEKTSGYPDLDSRAIEAIKKYLFSPLGKKEEQKEQWGEITVKYTLK